MPGVKWVSRIHHLGGVVGTGTYAIIREDSPRYWDVVFDGVENVVGDLNSVIGSLLDWREPPLEQLGYCCEEEQSE